MSPRKISRTRRLEPTLPGQAYADPKQLDRELKKIFHRSWLCAGRVSQVRAAGDYLLVRIGSESVIVTRDKQNHLRAFHNFCRHRGSTLCEGEAGHFDGSIRCPYHAWTYSLDGRLVGTPHLREGNGFSKDAFSLAPVKLDTWAGFMFVNLDPKCRPLSAQLGETVRRLAFYPLETLDHETIEVNEVEANWKILVENYLECYHCPGVHPDLCDIVPLYRRGLVDGPGGQVARFRDGAMTFTLGGKSSRPVLGGLKGEDARKYDGDLLRPNMFLNLFPDYAQVRTLWPLSPSRTRIISTWLFEPSTMARPDFDSSDAVEFIQKVGWEDWRVCERVQEGISSGAFGHGVYLPQEEYAAGFKRWVAARLATR